MLPLWVTNPQSPSASTATIGLNTQPIANSMSNAYPQPMYSKPYQKSGGKKWSSCLIITVVLVLACCVCSVVLSVVFFNVGIAELEEEKKLIVAELDKIVCDKSDADLSNTYRTKTSESFRQRMTEAEFIERAKKISKICDYLENNSVIDLMSQGTSWEVQDNGFYLESSNYEGHSVYIVLSTTSEGYGIGTFNVR